MKLANLGIDEIALLGNPNLRPSIDPEPNRVQGNLRVMKGMVDDYIAELKAINRNLHAPPDVIASLAQLEDQYNTLFGRNLIELGNTKI